MSVALFAMHRDERLYNGFGLRLLLRIELAKDVKELILRYRWSRYAGLDGEKGSEVRRTAFVTPF